MNAAGPFSWLCICILWTSITHFATSTVPTENVPPLMMLARCNDRMVIDETFTDLEEAKRTNLKIPSDNAESTFIILLCATPHELDLEDGTFTVREVVRKIDAIAEHQPCEYYRKPTVKILHHGTYPTYQIGFTSILTEEQLELQDLYADLIEKYAIDKDVYNGEEDHIYFSIRYDFDKMRPIIGSNELVAHMHSNDYDKECPDMLLGEEEFVEHKEDFHSAIFSVSPNKYVWRQLITMQDFAGIYATAATCTYLNYVLVHEDVVENLRLLEKSLRNVADITGKLLVRTSTNDNDEDSNPSESNSNSQPSDPSISAVLWKMLIYKDAKGQEFAILMIVHNKTIKRICNEEKISGKWGWPEVDRNGDPGTIYFCQIDQALANRLGIPWKNDAEKMLTLDLRKFPSVKIETLVQRS